MELKKHRRNRKADVFLIKCLVLCCESSPFRFSKEESYFLTWALPQMNILDRFSLHHKISIGLKSNFEVFCNYKLMKLSDEFCILWWR